MSPGPSPIHAFVQLAYGFGQNTWPALYRARKIPGLIDEYAYGYHHAGDDGCVVLYSTDHPGTGLARLVRHGLRFPLGFDIVHCWRNRREILKASVVWTHTESQTLSVALILLLARAPAVRLIGQSVWLMDEWPRLGPVRRRLYRRLLQRADILTFLSPVNRDDAKARLGHKRVEFVPFGINSDAPRAPRPPTADRPAQILALGNDRHRDWRTLLAAVADLPQVRLRIATQNKLAAPRALSHVEIGPARDAVELDALYAAADLVIVPLTENRHASGITAIEEATLQGKPVISTQVGGLEAYFTGDEVRFVPVGDAAALRAAIAQDLADPAGTLVRVHRAQAKIRAKLNSRAYARRHAELSRELLGLTGRDGEAS